MHDPVIRFNNVSKRFRLGATHDSLRALAGGAIGALMGRRKRTSKGWFWALRNVDFRVDRGEVLGIIGPNGAGKSTVLKLLSGILRPQHGCVCVAGRLAALIEVGAGFHGDLSGRENIFLNGTILGMNRREIASRLDSIVAFAGLERFLDMPVKRYSSGMYARLGFSIAAHVRPDVLLVDEVLSVGDAMFRIRCLERMRQLVREGTTLVFVTHDLDQMQKICTRTIVLNSGTIAFEGKPAGAVTHYLAAAASSATHRPTDDPSGLRSGAAHVVDLSFHDTNGEPVDSVDAQAPITMHLTLKFHTAIARLVLEVNIRRALGEAVVSLNSGRNERFFRIDAGTLAVAINLAQLPLAGGEYFCNVRAWDADRGTTVLDTPFRFPLVVNDGGRATGLLCVNHTWSLCSPPRSHDVADTVAQGRLIPLENSRESLPVR